MREGERESQTRTELCLDSDVIPFLQRVSATMQATGWRKRWLCGEGGAGWGEEHHTVCLLKPADDCFLPPKQNAGKRPVNDSNKATTATKAAEAPGYAGRLTRVGRGLCQASKCTQVAGS